MDKLSYKLVTSDSELEGAFAVRRQVFVQEQGIPEDVELDEHDREAVHMVVKDGYRVIGTARVLYLATGLAKIERMAILQPFRRRGVGRKIISFLSKELKNSGVEQVVLHAQYAVVAFYRSCGFKETGSPFREVGIKHVKMQKQL